MTRAERCNSDWVLRRRCSSHRSGGSTQAATWPGPDAAVLFGAAVVSALFAVIAARTLYATSPLRASTDPHGTTLPADPVAARVGLGWLVALTATGFAYLSYVPSDAIDLPFSRARQVSGLFLVGIATVLAGACLIGFARRQTLCYVRLTLTGVELAGLIRTQQCTWDGIADITDEPPNRQIRHPTVFVTTEGRRLIIQNTSGFAPNGAALYWLLRHYWKHPGDRTELTDGRAIERLRSEAVNPQ